MFFQDDHTFCTVKPLHTQRATHAQGKCYHAQKYVDGQLSKCVWIVTEWRLCCQCLSDDERQRRRILKRYRTHEWAMKVRRRTCHPASDGNRRNGPDSHLCCGSHGEHPCIGQYAESETFCQGGCDEGREKYNHTQLGQTRNGGLVQEPLGSSTAVCNTRIPTHGYKKWGQEAVKRRENEGGALVTDRSTRWRNAQRTLQRVCTFIIAPVLHTHTHARTQLSHTACIHVNKQRDGAHQAHRAIRQSERACRGFGTSAHQDSTTPTAFRNIISRTAWAPLHSASLDAVVGPCSCDMTSCACAGVEQQDAALESWTARASAQRSKR